MAAGHATCAMNDAINNVSNQTQNLLKLVNGIS